MAKRLKKQVKRTTTARVIGAVPFSTAYGSRVSWKVRMVATHFPFYIDANCGFADKKRADAEAEKWRKRKVTITITK